MAKYVAVSFCGAFVGRVTADGHRSEQSRVLCCGSKDLCSAYCQQLRVEVGHMVLTMKMLNWGKKITCLDEFSYIEILHIKKT